MRWSPAVTALFAAATAQGGESTTWMDPPEPIPAILDAPRTPAIRISPDNAWMVELERPGLPPIAQFAEPVIKVAGIKLNPATYGPSREFAYRSLRIRPLGDGPWTDVPLPEGARIRNVQFSKDGKRLAFTLTADDGIALWVLDLEDNEPRQLTGPVLNAVYGSPCSWLPGDDGLLCKVRVDNGEPPQPSVVPTGPLVEENLGRTAPARTYTNLLQSPFDEALFEYFLAARLEVVGLDGTRTQLTDEGLIAGASTSPDGTYVLRSLIERPLSYHVPASRFARRIEVLDRSTGEVAYEVARLSVADDVPIAHGSVRTGRRWVSWRSDKPSTLVWAEALDGGDAAAEAEWRDQVSTLAAPFDAEPTELWRCGYRFAGIAWGTDDLAMVWESWRDTRRVRTWTIDPSGEAEPTMHWDRSTQDAYGDPGSPLLKVNDFGRSVLRLTPDGTSVWLSGRGASEDGVYPFLDRYALETKETERIWQAADPWYESIVDVLDDDASSFITRRQSQKDPPNYAMRRAGKKRAKAITDYPDPAPQLAGLDKEVIRYERGDGLPLSASVYLPPGHDPAKDGPLPTVFWVYPSEYRERGVAGQVTTAKNTFSRPGGSSVLFLVTQGYAVVSNPKLPIIGEGEERPNDTYVEQLVAGAEAAVKAVVDAGIADPDRLIIGGHSYGAFTTANLLAHSDLFRTGIARSGAYNRSLTPFGFQGEARNYWEALDTYVHMSPFTHVQKINEPLLLIHGAEDPNSGTYPIQSERMYDALRGLGGTARWVVLPLEEHGYRSREAVGHALWEMIRWVDIYAAPREAEEAEGTE